MVGPLSLLENVNPLAQAEGTVHAVADGVQQQAESVSKTYDQDLKTVKESIESIKASVANGTIADRAGAESIEKFLGAMSGTTKDPKALVESGDIDRGDVVKSLAGNFKPQTAPQVTKDMLQKLDGLHTENETAKSPVGATVICTSQAGHRDAPTLNNGGKGSTEHPGADLAPPGGSDKHPDIVAAKSGVVVFAGESSGYGNNIVVMSKNEKGEIEYRRYAHLDSIDTQNVKVGETVVQGEKMGNMGDTGASGRIHLHYELRDKDFHVEAPEVDGKAIAKNQTIHPGRPGDNSAVAENKKPSVPFMPNGPTVDYPPLPGEQADAGQKNGGTLVYQPDPAKSYIGPQPATVAENKPPATPNGDKTTVLNAALPDASSKQAPDAPLVAENQTPHPFEAMLKEWRESSPSANYVSPSTGVKPQENTLARNV